MLLAERKLMQQLCWNHTVQYHEGGEELCVFLTYLLLIHLGNRQINHYYTSAPFELLRTLINIIWSGVGIAIL